MHAGLVLGPPPAGPPTARDQGSESLQFAKYWPSPCLCTPCLGVAVVLRTAARRQLNPVRPWPAATRTSWKPWAPRGRSTPRPARLLPLGECPAITRILATVTATTCGASGLSQSVALAPRMSGACPATGQSSGWQSSDRQSLALARRPGGHCWRAFLRFRCALISRKAFC